MKRILLPLLLCFLFCTSSCAIAPKQDQRFQASYLTLFDTVTTIVGFAPDRDTFSQTAQMIQEEMEEYHQLYDVYHSYEGINNLYTVNQNAGVQPVKVDKRILELLSAALEAYDLTDGKVNAAMGSVLKIWHTYREKGIDDPENAVLPPEDKLREAGDHTDIQGIVIDWEESTVYLTDPDMSLDVGAIAKGYATEQVARLLESQGVTGYTLSVGGNIRTIGQRGDGESWSIALQDPQNEADSLYTLSVGGGLSVVTSGSYQRYYTVDGVRYHHIIDPQSLMPENRYLSVSVIGEDSGLCDALSTALFNLSYEDGLELAESLQGIEVIWVLPDGSERYTSGFLQYIKDGTK